MEPMQSEGMTGDVTRMSRRADDRLQEARAQIAGTISNVTNRAKDVARYTHEGVQSNPWTAVGIGFGAGLVLGALAIFAASRR
jgi:ElaB/YqjD/DUF883 family membrane-anchored ribosome-binding protein